LDGRRLATASLVFDYDDDRWKLEQCKGYGNMKVDFKDVEPTDLHFLVADLVRLYQVEYEASGAHCP
jgi:hypothetical protein